MVGRLQASPAAASQALAVPACCPAPVRLGWVVPACYPALVPDGLAAAFPAPRGSVVHSPAPVYLAAV